MKKCKQQAYKWFEQIYGEQSIWDTREKIQNTCVALLATFFLDFFFYKTILAIPFLIPIGMKYLILNRQNDIVKRQQTLRIQFKDMMMILATNIRAGYAIENALTESYYELKLLYESQSYICKYVFEMIRKLQNNIPIEDAMQEFATISELEEVQEFTDVFRIAKKSGGNLAEIMNTSVTVIGKKIEVENEIQVMIAAKKLELKIMNLIPFGIILYIGVISPGFFDVLYTSLKGNLIMSLCLILYIAAYLIGERLVRIRV